MLALVPVSGGESRDDSEGLPQDRLELAELRWDGIARRLARAVVLGILGQADTRRQNLRLAQPFREPLYWGGELSERTLILCGPDEPIDLRPGQVTTLLGCASDDLHAAVVTSSFERPEQFGVPE